MARTTQNLDNTAYFEDKFFIAGELEEELENPLPFPPRRKTCNARVVLYCDPDCQPVDRILMADPVKGGRVLTKREDSEIHSSIRTSGSM